ncbi:GIY-YIG catalytic domain-containing protein [Pedobacter suwonensis]|uniref:GIY-YIG catalytic domain-containing protein n=1 Tax=Pedobacter suwonensis TaxID=332999 RepID=A0A1I0T9N2_9SPHI|nr:GIY-YIG nuclease family protein [Pedobacter suwonensis]SFA48451.1 GIY-YIG catalytic domain-containing protein [Pedobacter suwonensis]
MTYYLYILYSKVANLYYVGYTSDYVRRLEEHNNLAVSTFTSKHRPWHLKAVFSCGHVEAEAMRLEGFIKSQKSRKLIERMVKGEMLTGILAQLVRVPHVRD